MRKFSKAVSACAAFAVLQACATQPATLSVPRTEAAIVERAKALGVSDAKTQPAPDGGFTLNGKLEGDQFSIAFPAGWRGEGMVYAHGYSTPGTPIAVSDNPAESGPGGGVMGYAYKDGVAVGHSAYDKDGLGVMTGVINTKRLRDLLVELGSTKVYAVGDSMGGGIVVAMLEMYPHAFAGGLARCGVVNSWASMIQRIYDMRAAYNFLTAGTAYALPGEQDIRKTAISTVPPQGSPANPAYGWAQLMRVAKPMLALFAAAAKDPNGREASIMRQVAAAGGFEVDPGAIAFPILTAALGADDIAQTTGGIPYTNIGRSYASASITAEEADALNRGIQRVSADSVALRYFQTWHEATGRLSDPLVTMHNTIDSLVPYSQEADFAAAVAKAGRTKFLVQYGVAPTRAPLPVGGLDGYTHCGFSQEQTKASWEALRGWVTTGQRPAADAVK